MSESDCCTHDGTTEGHRVCATGTFAGKIAVVSGASSGIGEALVDRLVHEGATVYGLDIGAQDHLVERHGDAYVPARVDVTDEDAIAAAVAVAVEAHGRIDVAFPFAGANRVGPIEEFDRADWDFTVGLVLTGVFLVVKHAARAMTAGGAIVTVGSINARVPMRGGSAYVAAKAGVEAFTRNAALELSERGIRVNCVMPGLIETPLTQRSRSITAVREAFERHIPMGRAGRPEEIVDPALYLAGPNASYITGAALLADGGWDVANYPDLRGLFDE